MKKLTAAAIAAALTFSLFGCGKKAKDYDTLSPLDPDIIKPITTYFDGYNEGEPLKIIEAVFPQNCIELMKQNGMYDEQLGIITQMVDNTQKLWKENYGENCTLSATSDIVGAPMNDHELYCAKNYFKAGYEEDVEINIVEGYKVEFNYAVNGDTDKLEGVQKACVVRMDNDEWKMVMDDATTLIANYSGADVTFDNGE